MAASVFTGTIPALMTPCTARREPDFDALVRRGKELVGLGMSAVVYCGSMGDRPLLSGEQRQASELDSALGVLSSFDEGTDLVFFYKHLMVVEGNPEYALHFCETDQLTTSQKRYAERQLALFKDWYRTWSKAA